MQQGTCIQQPSRTPALVRAAAAQLTPLGHSYKDESEQLYKKVTELEVLLQQERDRSAAQQHEISQFRVTVFDLERALEGVTEVAHAQAARNDFELTCLRLELHALREKQRADKLAYVKPLSQEERKRLYKAAAEAVANGTWEYTLRSVRSVCESAGLESEYRVVCSHLSNTRRRQLESASPPPKALAVGRKVSMSFLVSHEHGSEHSNLVRKTLDGLKGKNRGTVAHGYGRGSSVRQARRDQAKTVSSYANRVATFIESKCKVGGGVRQCHHPQRRRLHQVCALLWVLVCVHVCEVSVLPCGCYMHTHAVLVSLCLGAHIVWGRTTLMCGCLTIVFMSPLTHPQDVRSTAFCAPGLVGGQYVAGECIQPPARHTYA